VGFFSKILKCKRDILCPELYVIIENGTVSSRVCGSDSYNKSVFSLVNSAVNVTLPTFAAERRAAERRHPPLSIDTSCLRGAQQQTRRTPQRLSNDGTNRRAVARRRPLSTYYSGSVSKCLQCCCKRSRCRWTACDDHTRVYNARICDNDLG